MAKKEAKGQGRTAKVMRSFSARLWGRWKRLLRSSDKLEGRRNLATSPEDRQLQTPSTKSRQTRCL